METGRQYLQTELPADVFNKGNGDVVTIDGAKYKTIVNSNGTRSFEPYKGTPFNFDYEKAAKDAYGELGVYYDRLLRESQGDLNLALARLVEDYDRGVRIKTEDTETANQASMQANQANALARGLYQKSLFSPFNENNPANPSAGMGLADVNNPLNAYGQTIKQRNVDFGRYKEQQGINLAREKVDLPEKQRRYAADLEQQRRVESASMAETRGNRALSKWQADQMILA